MTFVARFNSTAIDDDIFAALQTLSGQDFGTDWAQYLAWASRENLPLPDGYAAFKGEFFAAFFDVDFRQFFPPDVQTTAQINLLEAVWGGVPVDGIPSLVNARQITPEAAAAEGENLTQFCRREDCRYPATDELVFGVSINGDNRAYPLRLMNWHEMFNDVIGSTPLYDAPDGAVVCQFRAPTLFNAVARQGENWVQIQGYSAGCPESGWVAVESIVWQNTTWQAVAEVLPEDGTKISEGATPLGRIKGQPVMLAYCTLCGSGILYNTVIPELVVQGENQGETVLEFGSTGMLMRSNKLMYDRNTLTVWNAMTGEPAFGALADSGLELQVLPVVVTDWASWLAEHPDTSVLSLNTGYTRNYANGAAYNEYFNDENFIMFPVWQQDTRQLENKEMVFALNVGETPKAYPLDVLIEEQVTNDTISGVNLVLITRATPERDFFEPGGAAVRAYERGELTFRAGENPHELIDNTGEVWMINEEGLINLTGNMLPRIGGHLAFWFGWYSFHPDTLIYEN